MTGRSARPGPGPGRARGGAAGGATGGAAGGALGVLGAVVGRLSSRRPGRWLLWFGAAVLAGTALLALPVSRADGTPGGWSAVGTAAFTATGAVCGSGLAVVGVGEHWTGFGQAVLLVLLEAGALGAMVLACLVGLQVSDRLGLRSRMLTPGDGREAPSIRRVVVGALTVSAAVQAVIWVVVTWQLLVHGRREETALRAVKDGLFLAVSAWTNSGLVPWDGGLTREVHEQVLLLALLAGVVLGGLGYPVLHELGSRRRWRDWSVHSRLTMVTTAVLLVLGPLAIWLTEARNPATLGALPSGGAASAAVFAGIAPRSSSFAVFDYSQATPATLLVTAGLVLIGGGSGGTAGGIKVGTLAVLVLAVLAELRGQVDAGAYGRRITPATVRQALAVLLLSVAVLAVSAVVLLQLAPDQGRAAMFDAVSAFGGNGLSAAGADGRVDHLPVAARVLLLALAVLGRFGPIWLATRLAVRDRRQLYRYPETRPLVG